MIHERSPARHIGLAGFSPLEWPPPGTKPGLAAYARHFNAVEINSSFYAIPAAGTFRSWHRATPATFRFSIKMSREVTHGPSSTAGRIDPAPAGHLLRPGTLEHARLLLTAARALDDKLAAVLLQFPPVFDAARQPELLAFLDALAPLAAPAALAVEFRHRSWWAGTIAREFASRNICWVATDEPRPHEVEAEAPITDAASALNTPPPGARPLVVTSTLLYVRWLGRHGQFDDDRPRLDPSPRLRWWAASIRAALAHHPNISTILGFASHSFAADAPATARAAMALLDIPPPHAPSPTLFG